ncbi:unnamed protein product [Calypogeia fissa]
MQAVASVAGGRLVSSFVCNSRPLLHSIAQPRSLFQSQTIGVQSWTARRKNTAVFAASEWPSAKPSPSRGVVRDDIEGIPVGEYGERYLVPNHMEEDDDGLGDVRVECDSNGCIIVMPESRRLADEGNGGRYLRCDLSGCYFTPEAPAVKSFEVIEGEGWRLGYETAPESEGSFCAIVGAGGWSIALTGGEFDDFCTLIQSVRKGIMTMDEDAISGRNDVVLQVEKGTIWMQCTLPKTRVGALQIMWQPGAPDNLIDSQLKEAFELRFILSGGENKRQVEGYWPAEAVFDMLKKIDASSFNQSGASFVENIARQAAAKV